MGNRKGDIKRGGWKRKGIEDVGGFEGERVKKGDKREEGGWREKGRVKWR